MNHFNVFHEKRNSPPLVTGSQRILSQGFSDWSQHIGVNCFFPRESPTGFDPHFKGILTYPNSSSLPLKFFMLFIMHNLFRRYKQRLDQWNCILQETKRHCALPSVLLFVHRDGLTAPPANVGL